MDLFRAGKVGFWKLEASDEEWELKPDYIEALPRYLNGLDSVFARAQQQDEAQTAGSDHSNRASGQVEVSYPKH
jgi:hypothetical protein